MTHSAQLIILAVTKTGEKSLVLHTLSSHWGRRSFIVSVSRSSGMSLYLPLNILEAEVTENAKSDLWRLRGASAVSALAGIRSDVRKNAICMFMSEVLYRTIKDGADEDGLFEWCKKSILTLDALESDFANFHLMFLLEFCGVLGFSPSASDLAPFAGEHLQELSRLISLQYAEALILPMSGDSRNEMAEILLQYLSHHTESRIEIRSLRVLHELFR